MRLLDTNHCSRVIEMHPSIVANIAELGDPEVAVCPIIRGELIYGALHSERREANLRLVYGFLRDVPCYRLDNQTADIYASIKAAILDRFGPKDKSKRRKTTTVDLGFDENDIWIAAVAKRHGLTIVSSDNDFQRIREVLDLTVETWWTPDPIQPSKHE